MSDSVTFTCYGEPIPQGSTRAFVPKGWTRPIITAANKKTYPWRQQVAMCARVAALDIEFIEKGPVALAVDFYFDKPKSLSKKIEHKTTAPDVDKLARLIGDALTGIIYKDDAQVVHLEVMKRFGSPARAEIKVGRFPFGSE